MMPVRADEPLRRVTLNLYESDCQMLEKGIGHGWTEYIRQLVRNDCAQFRHSKPRRTLGDLKHD